MAIIDSDCIEEIPQNLHRAVTYPRSRDPKSERKTDQLAFEVAGRKIRNVTAGLCGLFRITRRSGLLTLSPKKMLRKRITVVSARNFWGGMKVMRFSILVLSYELFFNT